MRISEVCAGDELEWEETLDPHRGSFRTRRCKVIARVQRNILTADGWLYWGENDLGGPTTKRIEKVVDVVA